MFYELFPTLLSYQFILIPAAVVPALLLMFQVYRTDRLEKEPARLLWQLALLGVLCVLPPVIWALVFNHLLDLVLTEEHVLYGIIDNFLIVALAEEGCKYLMLRLRTWRSPEFNCQYDGVVYAVFVSLGFALFENILYVCFHGFGTAISRALLSVPGHAAFGVFMGVFYGLAKKYDNLGDRKTSRIYRVLAVAVPVSLHGTYDYILDLAASNWLFLLVFGGFIIALFTVSIVLITKASNRDRAI